MQKLSAWLSKTLSRDDFHLTPLQGDASFRRYYRLKLDEKSYIAVDSPPATEDNPGFIKVSRAFCDLRLHVPTVLHHDLNNGFLLLTDLGNTVFFNQVNKGNADALYQKALDELAKIQQCQLNLPTFDYSFMKKELDNFCEWFLRKHHKRTLTAAEEKLLADTFDFLLQSATTQPQCFIHRDYHSRNLMLLPEDKIGILDFQDAMIGPITYDLVSLIRDCYISWPKDQVEKWALNFHENYLKNIILSQEEFMQYVDLMGMQRHLKAIFIFARKFHRDGVDNYLNDIPRTLNYVLDISDKYSKLQDFKDFIQNICCDPRKPWEP